MSGTLLVFFPKYLSYLLHCSIPSVLYNILSVLASGNSLVTTENRDSISHFEVYADLATLSTNTSQTVSTGSNFFFKKPTELLKSHLEVGDSMTRLLITCNN